MKAIIGFICSMFLLVSVSYAQGNHDRHHRPIQRSNNQQITQTQTINNSSGPTVIIMLDDVFKYTTDRDDVFRRNVESGR